MSILTPELKAVNEKRAWRNTLRRKICSRADFANNAQYVHTPYDLCHDMVERIDQYGSLHAVQTFLTFNLEFVETLCYSMGIEKNKIWFITECLEKAAVARCHPRYEGINVIYADYLTWRPNMKFDVIAGNPPYNNDKTGKTGGARNDLLWPKFVAKSFELLKESGYLCLVHPQIWRKPEHKMWDVIASKQIEYLSIISKIEGTKLFGAITRCDWYVIKNTPTYKATIINDELGNTYTIDLRGKHFLSNYMADAIDNLLAYKDDTACDVIYNCYYHTQKTERMAKEKKGKFQYSCVHGVNKDDNGGIILWYSNTQNGGHFGVPKVIINDGEIVRPINDYKGEYGMTQHAFGIAVSSKKEGDLIVAAINTPKFQDIIKATKWSNFQTDYGFFNYLKRDFWKAFVNENGNEIK